MTTTMGGDPGSDRHRHRHARARSKGSGATQHAGGPCAILPHRNGCVARMATCLPSNRSSRLRVLSETPGSGARPKTTGATGARSTGRSRTRATGNSTIAIDRSRDGEIKIQGLQSYTVQEEDAQWASAEAKQHAAQFAWARKDAEEGGEECETSEDGSCVDEPKEGGHSDSEDSEPGSEEIPEDTEDGADLSPAQVQMMVQKVLQAGGLVELSSSSEEGGTDADSD